MPQKRRGQEDERTDAGPAHRAPSSTVAGLSSGRCTTGLFDQPTAPLTAFTDNVSRPGNPHRRPARSPLAPPAGARSSASCSSKAIGAWRRTPRTPTPRLTEDPVIRSQEAKPKPGQNATSASWLITRRLNSHLETASQSTWGSRILKTVGGTRRQSSSPNRCSSQRVNFGNLERGRTSRTVGWLTVKLHCTDPASTVCA